MTELDILYKKRSKEEFVALWKAKYTESSTLSKLNLVRLTTIKYRLYLLDCLL